MEPFSPAIEYSNGISQPQQSPDLRPVHDEVVRKHRGTKAGAKRGPYRKTQSAGALSSDAKREDPLVGLEEVPPVDTTLLVSVAENAVKIWEAYTVGDIESLAKKLSLPDTLRDQILEKCRFGEARYGTLKLSVDGIGKKYPMLTIYTPELGLVLCLGSYFMEIHGLRKDLQIEFERQKKAMKEHESRPQGS